MMCLVSPPTKKLPCSAMTSGLLSAAMSAEQASVSVKKVRMLPQPVGEFGQSGIRAGGIFVATGRTADRNGADGCIADFDRHAALRVDGARNGGGRSSLTGGK